MEKNERASASKRTRAVNVRFFQIKDYIEKGQLCVEYCPTNEMVADYMTKGLQGYKFDKFWKAIMGME